MGAVYLSGICLSAPNTEVISPTEAIGNFRFGFCFLLRQWNRLLSHRKTTVILTAVYKYKLNHKIVKGMFLPVVASFGLTKEI